MRDKRSTKNSGSSFEILPPDNLGLWKGDPEAAKRTASRQKSRKRNLILLGVLLLLASGIGTYRFVQLDRVATSSSDTPSLSLRDLSSDSSESLHTSLSQIPKESHIRIAETGEVPASLYASTLDTARVSLDQGNDAEAEAKLQSIPKEAFADRRVQQYAAVLWNNLGVKQRKGRAGIAGIAAFKTALSIDPTQPDAYRNLVTAYVESNDPALTREFVEKAARAIPEDPLPHLVLANMLYEKDDLAGAVAHLDLATERVGQYPELQAYIKVITAKVKGSQKAEQRFLTRESSHFTVKFDGEIDYALWNRVLEILEDAYREIGQQFGYFPSKPIVVVLHTRESFQGATGSPAWADGLFDPALGRIKVPTQGAMTDQVWLTRVLRHEFVHALLHDRMGGRMGAVPTWLNEGLAMQLAGDPWPDIDQIARGQIAVIPLNLLEGNWSALPQRSAMVAYLEGNSATLYLIDRFGMEKVREILNLLASGQPIAASVQDRLFIPYEEFQRRWVDNLNEKLRAKGI
jgi:hypothetical protein